MPQNNSDNPIRSYIAAMIFASWLGTYADLIMVQKSMYSFPGRPLASLFPINILFTLLVLPLGTILMLFLAQRMPRSQRVILTLFLAVLLPFIEQVSEKLGWFVHGNEWKHEYSFFGCILFSWLVWKFYIWQSKGAP